MKKMTDETAQVESLDDWLTPEGLGRFWQHVASEIDYENDPKSSFPEEIAVLMSVYRDHPFTDLVCIGPADGSRDPMMMVAEALGMGRAIESITCIDIASDFEASIRARLRPYLDAGVVGSFQFRLNKN